MARPNLKALQDRTYADLLSLFAPVEGTPRHNILKILSYVQAGVWHQLWGDLAFLENQIFPDSAQGNYLRSHWSDRVPPLTASAAVGFGTIHGPNGVSIPRGLLVQSSSGKTFYLTEQVIITAGSAIGYFRAVELGSDSNVVAGSDLTIISATSAGVSDTVHTTAGILGGTDAESDDAYLTRVLQYLRGGSAYGKEGDFAKWALDSSAEVDKAFEIPSWSVFGALLVVVVHGSQSTGLSAVSNLGQISAYISEVGPPIPFTVRTPAFPSLNPTIHLVPGEDTVSNRATAISRMQWYLQINAVPGGSITGGQLREAIVDGVVFTDATVTLAHPVVTTTVLELMTLGAVTWI